MDKKIEILPNASCLIESMRSMGYSFNTALADVIDNSISADAKNIKIISNIKDNMPYLQIIDDGIGMDKNELIEAMRLGSKDPNESRSEMDLGRFGLGLKSASFSQCRKLTVVSLKDGECHGLVWDLDIVRKTNKFEVQELDENDINKIENISSLTKSGTIVQWENFDKFNSQYQDLNNDWSTILSEAIEHISLIYHRYIGKDIQIYVNQHCVEAKDPFLINNDKTQKFRHKIIELDGEQILVQPYVLPQVKSLKKEDREKVSGIQGDSYQDQGFYIYRNKRLIIWGDYLGLARKSVLNKNARIMVDIPNSLDDIWSIDVKKSRAIIPDKIKKSLQSVVKESNNSSKRIYKYRGAKSISKPDSFWNMQVKEEDKKFTFSVNKENSVIRKFMDQLDEHQKKLFLLILEALAKEIPYDGIYYHMAREREYIPEEESSIDLMGANSIEELMELLQNKNNLK